MSRAVEAVYLWLLVTRSRPLPLLRPAPPRLILPSLVRVLPLLAMAMMGGLRLPLGAAVVVARATNPVVG